jgi:hypothetical protein
VLLTKVVLATMAVFCVHSLSEYVLALFKKAQVESAIKHENNNNALMNRFIFHQRKAIDRLCDGLCGGDLARYRKRKTKKRFPFLVNQRLEIENLAFNG